MKNEESIITILYELKTKYILVYSVIALIIIFTWVRDYYKNNFDDCRIFQNNMHAFILDMKVTSINRKKCYIEIEMQFETRRFLKLDKVFIDSLQIGDLLSKESESNQIMIIHKERKRNMLFSQVPNKDCK